MRKKSGGGGSGRGPLSQSLRRHLEAFDRLSSATEDDIVQHLRSNYPHHYHRTKASSLKTLVRSALIPLRRSNSLSLLFDEGDDGSESVGGSRKKRRRGGGDGGAEERLQRMEMARLRQIRKESELESESKSESGDSDSDDGAVSTSEDAVYGEKLEPKIDLMKSMLRDSYKANNKPKEEKDVEMEVPAREKFAVAEAEAVVRVGGGGGADGKAPVPVSGGNGGGGGEERPRFSDFGGMREVIKELEMEVLLPLYQPELSRWLGVRPMSGLLFHGPPGCGKTRLAHAIANEAGVPIYVISGPEIVSGVSGSSEENVRAIFTKAQRTSPSIVFIDEIDAIASKRDNLQREMERRIVTQLMTCMDESHRHVKQTDSNSESKLPPDSAPGYVLVIGATNRPDALDSALRRPGRFDREIVLGVPDEGARVEILSVLAKRLRLEGSIDLQKVARSTPGFVGADLTAVVDKAGNLAMRRIAGERKSKVLESDVDERNDKEWLKERLLPEEMEKLAITMQDFEEAVKMVQPSSKREGFSAIPDVKWEDVGGLDSLRQEFDRYIVRRIKYPTEYEGFGVNLETGFLLYGPPGCGKTLIAKAIANEAGANFIHIKGPELLSKYVGDSELAMRTLFNRARTCSPCVLFFDEVDALTTKRGQEGGWVVERLLNQFLIELDGAGNRRGVFVIGATNRPDVMDKALLRPGRFGKLLYVPLPSPDERGLILQAVSRKKPIDASVDLNAIARMEACDNFSGADLAALANEAALVALEEKLMLMESNEDKAPCTIKMAHFELAAKKITPSVTSEQIHKYRKALKEFKPV